MKNILKTVLFAIAAIALTFCSEDEAVNPTPASGLKINVSASSTRTVFDTDNIKWSGSEKMTLYINGTKNKEDASANVNTETGAAQFLFNTNITTPGVVKLQGVVPAASVLGVHTGDAANNNAGILQMELKPEQASTVETFDPAADILVSKDADYNITDDDINKKSIDAEFYFGRIMAITRYDVTNTSAKVSSDEIVEYVKLDLVAGEGNATKGLTGRFYFDISKGCFVDNKGARVEASVNPFYQGQSQTYVRTIYAEGSRPKLGELKFWAVTAPVALEAGDKLVFTIKTDKNTIVKTSTLKDAVSFVNTNLNTSTIKIADNETCNIDPVEAPSADLKTATLSNSDIISVPAHGYKDNAVALTAKDGTVWEFKGYRQAGNSNYLQLKNGDDAHIKLPNLNGSIQKIVLTVGKADQPSASGGENTRNYYFRTDLNGDNIVTSTADSKLEFNLTGKGDFSTGYIQVSGATRVFDVTVYYQESTDPKITVDEANAVKNLPAEGGAATVQFKAANLTGDVTASCNAAWVTDVTVSGTEVSFTAAATDLATERTAVLTIASETDGVSATVEIKQAPAAPVFNVTSALPIEFEAAGVSAATIEYGIAGTGAVEGAAVTATVEYAADGPTGWITNISANNTAVVFDVAENTSNTRNATIVLTYAKGDTVYTTARVEVSQKHAASVTEPTITVDTAEWAPAAEGGSQTFTVTLTDTDKYEVATPDWITVGEKTATSLTLTAKANDTGTERTATVTLSVTGGQPAEITVTQAAQLVIVTFDFSKYKNLSNNTNYTGETIGCVTLSTLKGHSATNSAGQIRIYANAGDNAMVFESTKTITKIVITYDQVGTFTVKDGNYTVNNKIGTWIGSSNKVSFTKGGTQARITKIEITCN